LVLCAPFYKTYGGIDHEGARKVHETSDQGFTLLGHTQSKGYGGSDYDLVKTDKKGQVEWDKTCGTSFNEVARSMVVPKGTDHNN